ncbi:MAG: exodeoxyribonuclease V subunit beta [Desulfatibacillum sp.]|nr:exodeoxyribonuclease V subunit beta [Desulfatibacillum sp.]
MAKASEAQYAPLEGVNLIEASAGTGKTYTLTSLFLRLLIEKRLFIEQILVVTFTVAATQELKDRIRQRLKIARDAFAGLPVDDPFVEKIVQENHSTLSRLRVEDAIRRFDEAAIFTIHGFCQRILGESAFESGVSFDAALVTETRDFFLEIAQDFWRKEFYQAPLSLIAHAIQKNRTPSHYAKLLAYHAKYPGIAVAPQADRPDLAAQSQFENARKMVAQSWPQSRDQVLTVLKSGNLKANQYGKPTDENGKAQAFITAMEAYVNQEGMGFPLFEQFKYFTLDCIQDGTKKNCTVPDLEFFRLCQDLQTAAQDMEQELDQFLLYLDREIFRFGEKTIPKRKNAKDIRFFDDLVINFKNALSSPMGPALVATVRKKYLAALIDEFQDTDSAQYEIFQALFSGRNQVLFLIGDPKQAIYAFRGADLFSYLQASRKAEKNYTLTHNWRSSPPLIQAVNSIFSRNKNPFVLEEIRFTPALPKPDIAPCTGPEKGQSPPMDIWVLPPRDGKAVGIGMAQDIAVQAVASEISRLLSSKHKGEYSPEDIAILVRKNSQALAVQEGLRQAGIHSVLKKTGNLFETPEALETRRILAAIANNRLPGIKSALSTSLLNWPAHRLERLIPGEAEVETVLSLFSGLHESWQQHGFIRMFMTFLRGQDAPATLLSLPEGERRLTNIMHLAEVLHQAEKERKLGVSGLIKWLDRQMDPATPRSEEHQLRLESDAQAVQVVTMHGSKGLEFPVVFCPFLCQDSLPRKGEPLTFHDPENNERLTLDLRGESSPNKDLAQLETLAENVRLAYVALTRAKQRCYVLWGAINKAGTSAPAYLLHGGRVDKGKVSVPMVLQDLPGDLEELARDSNGCIRVLAPPEEIFPASLEGCAPAPLLEHRQFAGSPDLSWNVTSFSALSMDKPGKAEPGNDEAVIPGLQQEILPESEEEGINIFTFPRGTGPGIMLHDLFENMDFTSVKPGFPQDLAAEKLAVYGFEEQWISPVTNMVDNVLSCPLQNGGQDFTLSHIPLSARSNEMEFYFPIKKISPGSFAEVFGTGPEKNNGRLFFSPVKGFIRGFMDMVFCFEGRYYIVDWKSNHLGNQVEDYGQESLARAMMHHKYDLQYLLYTLALDLHLKQRLKGYTYERDFGGVFYIFLRGVDKRKGPEYGIFHDCPSRETIQHLKSNLL